ncbi:uncharacterized protein ACLA_037640 [Aspergillus clavatus NRRL 1]|uniref:Calcofluor white hypersensitive protein n=1 Tax=Aspergillus clavatus (strain ATCC 1007 / CBS 513.65 / DSM 816 / NCTC 3887 / NRRL 1 / QM 1276 / 107) TaxID=344612 RepID=A1CK83_ASPCL|nr:uncharacterized protein ACLA_037640 [Aspergillus clavatus NRRL 1]EAW09557.1 conserved hypothetical protein [Aspergillus clavatus NRRL 1]
MSKSRAPMYLGLAAAGGLGYYMYRAGGDPQIAKKKMEIDAHRASAKIPRGSQAERVGESFGKEASQLDEATSNARTKGKADERIPEIAQEGLYKIDQLRHEAATKVRAGVDEVDKKVDQFDRTVEKKAAEAKGTLSGWFGSK